MAGGSSSVATDGTKKKKKGIFKSLGKGLSYKKKKNRPDDESVVGVNIESSASGAQSRSVSFNDDYQPPSNKPPPSFTTTSTTSSSTAQSSQPPAKPIQVVLLLMDPTSRRFELLQLEFDSTKAMVSDVLRQIKCSATESSLRDMTYGGVADITGMEMIATMKLSKFCNGNDVVMAIPGGMSGGETAKLAGPILGDPKVEEMLAPCGIKVQIAPATKSPAAGGGGASKLAKITEENETKKKSSPRVTVSSNANGGKGSASSSKKKSSSSTLPTVFLGIILSALFVFTISHHISVTTRLESGYVLRPGDWKSRCGIFDLFPEAWLEKLPFETCDKSSSAMLEMGKDGTLRYFTNDSDGMRKEVWSVVGGQQCVEGEEGCEEAAGAMFEKEGYYWYVNIGGSRSSLSNGVIKDFASEV